MGLLLLRLLVTYTYTRLVTVAQVDLHVLRLKASTDLQLLDSGDDVPLLLDAQLVSPQPLPDCDGYRHLDCL